MANSTEFTPSNISDTLWNDTIVCQNIKTYFQSPLWVTIVIIVLVGGTMTVVPLALTIGKLVKQMFLHPTSSALLLSHFIAALILVAANFFEVGAMVVRAMNSDPCHYGLTTLDCRLWTLPQGVAGMAFFMSMTGLGIHRAIITYKGLKSKPTDSKSSCNVKISVLVVAAIWLLAFGMPLKELNLNESKKMVFPLCVRVYSTVSLVEFCVGFSVYLAINAGVLGLYLWTLYTSRHELFNFAINQAQIPLAIRLQLRRSINITESLYPSVVFQVFRATVLFILTMFQLSYFNVKPIYVRILAAQFNGCVFLSVTMLIHVMLFWWRLNKLVPKTTAVVPLYKPKSIFSIKRRQNPEKPEAVADVYFRAMKESWQFAKRKPEAPKNEKIRYTKREQKYVVGNDRPGQSQSQHPHALNVESIPN